MVARRNAPSLRSRLRSGPILVAPGAYDALSARLIEQAGFEAVYASGAGASYSLLGKPDLGLLSFAEMRDQVRRIVDAVCVPVIADGDMGHGGILNVARTVQEFEAAGASAVQLEDQSFPKRCGHLAGKELIAVEEMAAKVRAAAESRSSDEFLIIARTDAIAVEGLDDALSRAGSYADAGADILFVEAPPDIEAMRCICRETRKPQMANMVEGGKTPLMSAAELEEIGYRVVIFPGSGARATAFALRELYATLRKHGTTEPMRPRMLSFSELNEVIDLAAFQERDRKYASPGARKEARRKP